MVHIKWTRLHFWSTILYATIFKLCCSLSWYFSFAEAIITGSVIVYVSDSLSRVVFEAFSIEMVSLTGYLAITDLLNETVFEDFCLVLINWLPPARNLFISASHPSSVLFVTLTSSAFDWRSKWENNLLRTDLATSFFMNSSVNVKFFPFMASSEQIGKWCNGRSHLLEPLNPWTEL